MVHHQQPADARTQEHAGEVARTCAKLGGRLASKGVD
jgi:hypothetical protein